MSLMVSLGFMYPTSTKSHVSMNRFTIFLLASFVTVISVTEADKSDSIPLAGEMDIGHPTLSLTSRFAETEHADFCLLGSMTKEIPSIIN
jgi:hypothetical protein